MTTLHSEEYYRTNWERFIAPVPGKHYVNLEAELNRCIATYSNLPEEAITIMRKVEAAKIAEKTKALVVEEMQTVKAIAAGEASFGYTTKGQEISAMREYRMRFEFNCLQLADFKKKYGIA